MEKLGTIDFTDFARRHFDPKFNGTKISKISEKEFLTKLQHRIDTNNGITVTQGYADFCKIITVENFAEIPTGSLKITIENYHNLRSGYKARNENELAVLSRWFELPLPPPMARVLSIVLYNKHQIELEELTRTKEKFNFNDDWGIVSVMAHMEHVTEPINPATQMRNALGIEEGGSGVQINKKEYNEAVEYWNYHAVIKF